MVNVLGLITWEEEYAQKSENIKAHNTPEWCRCFWSEWIDTVVPCLTNI